MDPHSFYSYVKNDQRDDVHDANLLDILGTCLENGGFQQKDVTISQEGSMFIFKRMPLKGPSGQFAIQQYNANGSSDQNLRCVNIFSFNPRDSNGDELVTRMSQILKEVGYEARNSLVLNA